MWLKYSSHLHCQCRLPRNKEPCSSSKLFVAFLSLFRHICLFSLYFLSFSLLLFFSAARSCATCNVNNYASRDACYKCHQPKAAVAAPSPQQLMGLLGGALAGHLGGGGGFMGGSFGAPGAHQVRSLAAAAVVQSDQGVWSDDASHRGTHTERGEF
jgi:hypothetical protein